MSLKRHNEESSIASDPSPKKKIAKKDHHLDIQQAPVPSNHTRDRALHPYPFFYYNDFSTETDPDPLTPLTFPGRVPNFPAKLHSILSNPDFADIVAWMPHGRAWRVLKPREFEIRVIPTYFEHAKFASFVRQANGWGFRRITQGEDRNSYYHERFLRGLPHLCKDMKRPAVAEKKNSHPEHEPDLSKISEMRPLPEKSDKDLFMFDCTLSHGPKARMPISAGFSLALAKKTADSSACIVFPIRSLIDHMKLETLQQSINLPERQVGTSEVIRETEHAGIIPFMMNAHPSGFIRVGSSVDTNVFPVSEHHNLSVLAAANQFAMSANANVVNALRVSASANVAASQFAAGFAAATALSHQQSLHTLFGSLGVPGHQQHLFTKASRL